MSVMEWPMKMFWPDLMGSPAKAAIPALLAGWLVLAGGGVPPADAQGMGDARWNALYDRIIRLEHEVRSLRAGGATGGGVSASVDGRLKAIELELADLRRLLDRRLRDFDLRLRALEKRKGAQRTSPTAPTRTAGALSSPTPSTSGSTRASTPITGTLPPAIPMEDLRGDPDLFAGSTPRLTTRIERPATRERAGEQVLGRLRVDKTGRPLPPGGAGGVVAGTAMRGRGGARPLPGVPTRLNEVPPVDTSNGAAPLVPERVEAVPLPAPQTKVANVAADDLLERARNDFLARRYGEAAQAYRAFLQRAGNHPARAEATYELGETYYLQGRYRDAGKAFLDTYKKFPASRVAPQALFKLGQSLKHLGQAKQACRTWKLLRERYASSRAARLQAPREMKRAKCRG